VSLLGASGPEASAAADEARTTFERIGAAPYRKLLDEAVGAAGNTAARRAAPVSDAAASAARVE
jgi:hypothetical protein